MKLICTAILTTYCTLLTMLPLPPSVARRTVSVKLKEEMDKLLQLLQGAEEQAGA